MKFAVAGVLAFALILPLACTQTTSVDGEPLNAEQAHASKTASGSDKLIAQCRRIELFKDEPVEVPIDEEICFWTRGSGRQCETQHDTLVQPRAVQCDASCGHPTTFICTWADDNAAHVVERPSRTPDAVVLDPCNAGDICPQAKR